MSAPPAVTIRKPGTAPVVFFDGTCGLCNRFVAFARKRDQAQVLRFAPLQGSYAAEHLQNVSADITPTTMYLLDQHGLHNRSTAALRTLRYLHLPWRWGAIFLLIPKPIRDGCYAIVAKHRYRIFGRTTECRLPTAEERAVFLD